MASSLHIPDKISEFENLSKKITKAIIADDDEMLVELDRASEKLFEDILTCDFQTNEEAQMLITFLLNHLVQESERTNLEKRICTRIRRVAEKL